MTGSDVIENRKCRHNSWAHSVLFFLQLAVVMWLLTYVGAVFNGITLLILGKHHKNKRLFSHKFLLVSDLH